MGRHEQKLDTFWLLSLRLSVWRIPIQFISCTSNNPMNLKVIQLLNGGSRRTSVRYLLLLWQRTNVNTSRGTAIVKWNTGHILPANVHLFHEGKFPPKVYIWEKWVQKFSVARETVFQCNEQEQLAPPCSNSLILCDFLQLPCSSGGLVPLFPWRWPFILVSCLPLSCTALMAFFLFDNSLHVILQQGWDESSFSAAEVLWVNTLFPPKEMRDDGSVFLFRQNWFVQLSQTPGDALCSICITSQLNITDYPFNRAVALGNEDIKGLGTSKRSVACLYEDHTDAPVPHFHLFTKKTIPETSLGHIEVKLNKCLFILFHTLDIEPVLWGKRFKWHTAVTRNFTHRI